MREILLRLPEAAVQLAAVEALPSTQQYTRMLACSHTIDESSPSTLKHTNRSQEINVQTKQTVQVGKVQVGKATRSEAGLLLRHNGVNQCHNSLRQEN